MKQYAIIGMSSFGKQILEDLITLDCEIILIDKDPELIDYFKNDVTAAYIADVINEDTVRKLVPPDIDAAIVDLGDSNEASILATLYLKKLGIKRIIVRAETNQHGEILTGIGAHHVVYPNLEAAKRVTPMLVSDILFNYVLVSGGLVLAETGVPEDLVGKSLARTNLRQTRGINVVAVHKVVNGNNDADENERNDRTAADDTGDREGVDDRDKDAGRIVINPEPENYEPPETGYLFQEGDKLLVTAKEEDIVAFTNRSFRKKGSGFSPLSTLPGLFRRFLKS